MWRRAGSADDLDHEVVEPEDLWELTGDDEGVGPEGSELLRCPEWDETVWQHEAFLAEPMDFRALFETRSAAAAAPSEGAGSEHSAGRGSECPLAPRQRPAQDQAESSDTETELGLCLQRLRISSGRCAAPASAAPGGIAAPGKENKLEKIMSHHGGRRYAAQADGGADG